MKRRADGSAPRRPTLAAVLHRVHLRVALVAVCLAGLSVFVVALVTLRFYMVANLNLAASTIAYTVEAAIVFDDREAARESMAQIAAGQAISRVRVIDRAGSEFARWEVPEAGARARLEHWLGERLLGDPAHAPVSHDGRPIGSVTVDGSGRDILSFLVICLGSALLCLALSGLVAYRLSLRASREILRPLWKFAATVAAARRAGRFDARVEPTGIAELHNLGDDVNALLSELERWQAQVRSESASLEFLANHDPLTGLANRAQFDLRLQQALLSAGQNGSRVAVFFIDADRFKSINDELGHEAGDVVLQSIARRLRGQVREDDLVARLGGDEFAVLLAPLRQIEHAHRIAGNMLACMQDEIALPGGTGLHASLSIGIAFYPEHAGDAAGLLKRADDAMYRAKRTQRGSYCLAPSEEEGKGENA